MTMIFPFWNHRNCIFLPLGNCTSSCKKHSGIATPTAKGGSQVVNKGRGQTASLMSKWNKHKMSTMKRQRFLYFGWSPLNRASFGVFSRKPLATMPPRSLALTFCHMYKCCMLACSGCSYILCFYLFVSAACLFNCSCMFLCACAWVHVGACGPLRDSLSLSLSLYFNFACMSFNVQLLSGNKVWYHCIALVILYALFMSKYILTSSLQG